MLDGQQTPLNHLFRRPLKTPRKEETAREEKVNLFVREEVSCQRSPDLEQSGNSAFRPLTIPPFDTPEPFDAMLSCRLVSYPEKMGDDVVVQPWRCGVGWRWRSWTPWPAIGCTIAAPKRSPHRQHTETTDKTHILSCRSSDGQTVVKSQQPSQKSSPRPSSANQGVWRML
jgi:hypothetical protein